MSFLSQSFQSQSASNTASIISRENSSQEPLGAINNYFTGKFVPSSNYSVLQLTVSSNTLVEIIVEQSFLGVNYDEVSSVFFNTQEDIDTNRAAPFYAFITLPFMRIIVQNIDIINNTKLNLCTKLTSTPPPASEISPAHVIIDGQVQVSSIIDALPAGTNEIGAVSLLAYNIYSGSNLPLHVNDNSNLKVVEENSSDILSSIQLIDATIRPSEALYASAINTTFNATAINDSSSKDASSVIYGYDSSTDNYIAASVVPYTSEIGSYSPTELLVREHNSAAIATSVDAINNSIQSTLNPTTGGFNAVSSFIWAYNATTGVLNGLQCDDTLNLKVVEKNSGDILSAVDSIDGKITACNTDAVVISSGNINIDNFPATQPISGSVSILGTAQVQDLPLENIAGINALRPVYNMVVGNWYRVANTGNTSGAVWIEIGAPLFNGAILPDIGILFQCLYVYLNYSTTGTVWDVPYNTDAVIIASGNITETNSTAILNAVASIDGHIIGCNTDAVIISSGSITETNSTAIAASVASIDGHIIGCNTDAVIIASGSITETNSAAIAASVASIDGHIIACDTDAVIIASGSITETNSAAIAASVASIDGHIIECNTGAVVISSGSINTLSSGNASSQTSVPTIPITAGIKWNSPSSPMTGYSLIQVALKASSTSVTSTMTFNLEYSPNNADWFSSNEILSFTNGGTLNIMTAGASFTSMPYVRVSYDPPALSTDTASNVIAYFLKKSTG